MKNQFVLILLLLMIGVSGCASSPDLVLGPVGPARPVLTPAAPSGTLVVFSELESSILNSDYANHGNYRIYNTAGQEIRHVINYISPVLEDPVQVQLPPGAYMVKARAANYGPVYVRVIIEKDNVTTVHLDGSDVPEKKNALKSQLVSLPNGKVVGWAANSEAH